MRALERGALSGSLANFGRYTRASELSVSVSFCTLGASERFYVTLAADGTSDDYPIDATSGLSDATLTIASDDLYEYDYPSILVAHSTPSVTLALADAEEDDAKFTVGPAIGVQSVDSRRAVRCACISLACSADGDALLTPCVRRE